MEYKIVARFIIAFGLIMFVLGLILDRPVSYVIGAMLAMAGLAAHLEQRQEKPRQIPPGVFRCTSTTRPIPFRTGEIIYETDTGKTLVWDRDQYKELK
jgi:hypothetical protein